MKLRLTAMILLSLCLSQAFADEGMWLLGNLRKNKQAERVMKELGLQMPVNKLYNPKKPALANAVVSFGGFCSGVVVSEDGLVFTNHHCGFSSIQQHSSVEHDYLKDGFVARNLGEELPNPELYVRFLLRTEDVTKRVLSAAKHAHTESERRVVVDSVMNVIGMEVSEKDSTLTGIVDAYYAGNEFWLSVYRDYNDVRLVFAPPSSVGKHFAGELSLGFSAGHDELHRVTEALELAGADNGVAAVIAWAGKHCDVRTRQTFVEPLCGEGARTAHQSV